MKAALITGIAGQDGSYLAELLLGKGYKVAGTVKNLESADFSRISHLKDSIRIFEADLLSQDALISILREWRPGEVYNLAAHSLLAASFEQPVLAGEYIGLGVARILEAIRTVDRGVRFFQASSSEIFGHASEVPQSERTPPHPRHPYGVAKAYGHFITMNYREFYRLFACSGILFNHESPRRSPDFVTRKITLGAAKIKLGLANELRLGNLDARRDWGFAGDYVRAFWLMLQQERPDDFVIATGTTHSVRELCEEAFSCVGLSYQDYVISGEERSRPPETAQLVGDPSKARSVLGWEPTVSFRELVGMMVESDLRALSGAGTAP